MYNVEDAEKVIAVLTSKKNLTGRRSIPLDNEKLKQIPKSKRGSLLGIETNLMVHIEGCLHDARFALERCVKKVCPKDCTIHCKVLPGHGRASLCRKLANGMFKRISSSIKPSLTDLNTVCRVIYPSFR